MMIWAPFAKSPNCASQIVRKLGSELEFPYSKPSTAISERTVVHAKLFVLAQLFQRIINLTGVHVVVTGVAVGERAAHAILAERRTELPRGSSIRKHLRHAPIDRQFSRAHLLALFDKLRELRMDVEAFRRRGDLFRHTANGFNVGAGLRTCVKSLSVGRRKPSHFPPKACGLNFGGASLTLSRIFCRLSIFSL